MKTMVVGGSGYIGRHVVEALLARGHQVGVLARSQPSNLPAEVDFHQGDASALMRGDWVPLLRGCDAVVFAAGADSRASVPQPSGSYFYHHNVASVSRLMEAARRVDITRAVILGSYNVTLHRQHPELQLPQRHPYIASRVAQAIQARDAAGPDCTVAVLEIPYVFGSTPGRPNQFTYLTPWLSGNTRLPLMAPPGGTALVTAAAIGTATCSALTTRLTGNYPVAQANQTWTELVSRLARAAGHSRPDDVKRIPAGAFTAYMRATGLLQQLQGRDNGLNAWHYPTLFTGNMFIPTCLPELGINDDDLDHALFETITASAG